MLGACSSIIFLPCIYKQNFVVAVFVLALFWIITTRFMFWLVLGPSTQYNDNTILVQVFCRNVASILNQQKR